MQKVCFISANSSTYGLLTGERVTNVGGAELQISLIAKYLRAKGHPVSVLVHDFGQPDIVTTDDGTVLIKTFGLKKCGLLLKYLTFLRLFRGMSLAGADVYYQRCSGPITGFASLWCKWRRRKFVFAVANDADLDGTFEGGMGRIVRALYRFGINNADTVSVQTERQKELFEERFHRACTLIRNIYQVPEYQEHERRYILWVSQFYFAKRPRMLLEIAKRMPDYKFVMVGGPGQFQEHLFDEVRSEAEEIANLEIRGAVQYSEMGKIYAQALAFVNTSEFEGFPNTYLDAMSRRVPVIATFDPDEIICKHNLGFHGNTADELISGLQNIVEDTSLREKLAENAYQYVKTNHEMSVIGRQYETLLYGADSKD